MSETVGSIRKHTDAGVTWVDGVRPDRATFQSLEETYKLHPVHVKESLQKVQHAQVEHGDSYLFLVLHVPVYNSSTHKLAIHQIGMFLGKDFLLTIRTDTIPALERLWAQAEDYKLGSAYLLYELIAGILDDMFVMAEHIETELDNIENRVFGDSRSDSKTISRIRQKIVRLSRVVGPKRVALDDLAQQISAFAGKEMTPYYHNNTKTVNRLWEIVEEERETVEIYKDADFTASTEQTNKTLAVLTIIFTLSIPTTVVAALYGMNVTLPGGLETGPWMFLGRYTTAILIFVGSLLFAWLMYLFFRLKKWL